MKWPAVHVRWEPRDMWIGLYWDRVSAEHVRFYVCLVPCIVIVWAMRIRRRG